MKTKDKLLMVLAFVSLTGMDSAYALDDLYGKERTESRAEALSQKAQERQMRKAARRLEALTNVKILSEDYRVVSYKREDPSLYLPQEKISEKLSGRIPVVVIEETSAADSGSFYSSVVADGRIVVVKSKENVEFSQLNNGTVIAKRKGGEVVFRVATAPEVIEGKVPEADKNPYYDSSTAPRHNYKYVEK